MMDDTRYDKQMEQYYRDIQNEAQKSTEVKNSNKNNLLKMDEVTNEITLSKNINTRIICVNEDKLELILNEYCRNIEKKTEFVTPLSLIITIVATLTTAKFSDRIFSAAVWESMFWIALVICIIWLIKAIACAFSVYKYTKVKAVLNKISGGEK